MLRSLCSSPSVLLPLAMLLSVPAFAQDLVQGFDTPGFAMPAKRVSPEQAKENLLIPQPPRALIQREVSHQRDLIPVGTGGNPQPNFLYAIGIGNFMGIVGIPQTFAVSFGLMAFTTFVSGSRGAGCTIGFRSESSNTGSPM